MNQVVQGFVAQISELARRAAIDTLESAFGAQGSRGGGSAAIGGMPASGLGRVGRPRGGRGAKRTAEEMHELCEKVASFVKTHPGLRIELINKELGTATKELALPIRKLLADSVITSKGEKRATTYFPGKKAFKG